jgi:hypothetical protein
MSLPTSIPLLSNTPPYLACHSPLPACPEAEFLEEIQTKILKVFLLAIHSHLYRGRIIGRNPNKSFKSCPSCYSQSPLQTSNSWTKSSKRVFLLAIHSHLYKGRILGRNPDISLKNFPPCYSQSPLRGRVLRRNPDKFWRVFLLDIHSHLFRGRIHGRNPDKSLKSFPPFFSQSLLQLCLEISISSNSRNLLHISSNSSNLFYSSVTVHC